MKKNVFLFLTIVVLAFFFNSCSNGSSGTTTLNLGDVRLNVVGGNEKSSTYPALKDLLENMFIVLPGPYEFTWTELDNVDGSIGREQCRTQLKIKLKLKKSLKDVRHFYGGKPVTEEEVMEAIEGHLFRFMMLDSEGRTSHENEDGIMLYLYPELKNLWGTDGRISSKKNTDGILDFIRFLFSEPGTEYELVLDCSIALCKEIDDMIGFNKGMRIDITPFYKIDDCYWAKK